MRQLTVVHGSANKAGHYGSILCGIIAAFTDGVTVGIPVSEHSSINKRRLIRLCL